MYGEIQEGMTFHKHLLSLAITFDPGEIGGGSFYEKSLPGAAFTLPECSFRTIPEGMKFVGWLLNGSETVYKPGDEVTAARDMGFTAQWEKELIVRTYPEGILKEILVDLKSDYL